MVFEVWVGGGTYYVLISHEEHKIYFVVYIYDD